MSNSYRYQPHKPSSNRARIVIWTALFIVLILLIWAYFAKIDQVTRATATVIASARTQEIQASARSAAFGVRRGARTGSFG